MPFRLPLFNFYPFLKLPIPKLGRACQQPIPPPATSTPPHKPPTVPSLPELLMHFAVIRQGSKHIWVAQPRSLCCPMGTHPRRLYSFTLWFLPVALNVAGVTETGFHLQKWALRYQTCVAYELVHLDCTFFRLLDIYFLIRSLMLPLEALLKCHIVTTSYLPYPHNKVLKGQYHIFLSKYLLV